MNFQPTQMAADRGLLRLVACGSVDDGKSTLIGRLLAETNSVPDDQLQTLARLSQRFGTTGDDPDYALLLDGLEAEREQGITIDVAYRYFSTIRRAFRVADTPGHEQYTRNMVTGASNADFALLLVDARAGLTTQTMRHARVAALLGIRHCLLIVNKMDLVDFSAERFAEVETSFRDFAAGLGFAQITAIPVSARHGDNVTTLSKRMPWYGGDTVLGTLETVDIGPGETGKPLRFVVQSAIRADGDFRGYAGYVAAGVVTRGEMVTIPRTKLTTRVERIVTFDGDLDRAEAGQAVTLVFADHTDVGRGDIVAPSVDPPDMTDQFAGYLLWLDQAALMPGRTYLLRHGASTVTATVTALKHKVDVENGDRIASRTLDTNDIGVCNFLTMTALPLDPYAESRPTGAFVLIDRTTAATVGAGMVVHSLRRASNVKPQKYAVEKSLRAHMKAQHPAVVWFTGLPSAGKSTIMNLVDQRLTAQGLHTYVLDGDNLRRGLNRDLGFTNADRVENIRRAGEVARLMVDAGLIVLCAFISPFRAEREMVREMVGEGEFVEVFVDTPLDVCIQRDPKGLYKKAKAGQVFNVTGLDSPYEPPEHPDIHLLTTEAPAEALADQIVDSLLQRNLIER